MKIDGSIPLGKDQSGNKTKAQPPVEKGAFKNQFEKLLKSQGSVQNSGGGSGGTDPEGDPEDDNPDSPR